MDAFPPLAILSPVCGDWVKEGKIQSNNCLFFADQQCQESLEDEGIDALAFIQKCVRKRMKEILGENKKGR